MCFDAHAASASSGWPVTSPSPTVFASSSSDDAVPTHEDRAEGLVAAVAGCSGQVDATAQVGDVNFVHRREPRRPAGCATEVPGTSRDAEGSTRWKTNMLDLYERASEWTLEKVQGAASKLGRRRRRATSGTCAR